MSTPEEVAAAVTFLAGEEAGNIHGAILVWMGAGRRLNRCPTFCYMASYAYDTAVLLLRVVLGLTMAAHGYNKFFGGGRIPAPRVGSTASA